MDNISTEYNYKSAIRINEIYKYIKKNKIKKKIKKKKKKKK